MEYTTISISKDLKKEILILKVTEDKATLEDLLRDMCEKYTKSNKGE